MNYDAGSDNPTLIALCMNCTREDCEGICMEYKQLMRDLYNVRRIRRRPKAERVPGNESGLYTAFGERHTVWEWSQIYGIRYKTLYERIRRSGMTMEEALTRPLKKASIPKVYTVGGESRTIKEWSQVTGLSLNTIYARLARGWTPGQAVGREPRL